MRKGILNRATIIKKFLSKILIFLSVKKVQANNLPFFFFFLMDEMDYHFSCGASYKFT